MDAVQPPDPAEWKTVQDLMINNVTRERADGLYRAFMQNLFSRANVEVVNQDVVDRKDM